MERKANKKNPNEKLGGKFFQISNMKFPELEAMLKDGNVSFEEFEKHCTEKVFELMTKLVVPEEKHELVIKYPEELYKKIKLELSIIKTELALLEQNTSVIQNIPKKKTRDVGTQTSSK